jgi:uncharacterized protein (UPF0212 family)
MPTADLLAVWERAAAETPVRRAVALLGAAVPERSEDDLLALPIGRRDASLLTIRETLFGSAFDGVTRCPACGEEIEVSFDASEVRREEVSAAGPLRAGVDGIDVEFRLPNSADLAAIADASDVATARAMLFARCIVAAARDGSPLTPAALPAAVVEAVSRRMAAEDPQADVQVAVTCPSCGEQWGEPFDVVTFLWSELSAAAVHLLGDVHLIASAYGWSEGEILRLSPARRNAYLEMLR